MGNHASVDNPASGSHHRRPSRDSKAVEEILRIEAASPPADARPATSSSRGQHRRSDQLLLMLCSANRDPDAFAHPADFDINRSPNRHLSFAPGAPLSWLTSRPHRVDRRA